MKRAALILIAGLLNLPPILCAAATDVTVAKLRCEDRASPLGIDLARPRFSWHLEAGSRNQTQTAYQVVVEGQWDSGKVVSPESLHIEYNGPALAAKSPYVWKVRVWDGNGEPSDWSGPETFTTGIADWSAKWIGRDEIPNAEIFGAAKWIWYPEGSPAQSAPVGPRYFKRNLTLPSAPTRAILSVTADDEFQLFINGTAAGTGIGFSRPGEFDVTSLMQGGANVITITANNLGTAASPAGLIARLNMAFASGPPIDVGTDSQWLASKDNLAWTAPAALGSYGMAPWGTMNVRQLNARYLRDDFQVDPGKQVKRATAYVCGLGFFDLFLNGKEVSDHVMDPALSDYTKANYYVTFDVTGQIQPDANAIGVILGNGRFLAPRFHEPAVTQTFGFPKLLVQLEIEYQDGSRKTVISDENWKLTDGGPIRRNNEYDGEEYDARMEMPGWDMPGFDAAKWQPVQLVAAPGGALKSQLIEPMRVTRIIRPVAITNPSPGKYIVDMGESFYGSVRLKGIAAAGTTVNLLSAYSLKPDGSLKTADNRGALCMDTYIFKGDGVEIWNPRFKGQGFRHVEVTGFPGVPTLDNFEGLMIHTDVETVGSFESADPLTNDIHAALNRGMRMFLRSAPLDPDRDERQAWGGDSSKNAESEAYNYNVAPFYTKWMDDVERSQRSDGTIPDVATYWTWGEGVEWASVFTIIPDWFVEFYGDHRLADNHYTAMKTWVLAMRKHEQADGTLGATSYGDWCDASTMDTLNNNGSTPGNLVSSAYQYHNLRIMERLASFRGATADQQNFAQLAEKLKTAFNARFFNSTTNIYQGDTQCGYVLALKFGLVPATNVSAVAARLADNVMVNKGGHLSVGLIGMQWLMQTLTDVGRADVAWTIATKTTRPSWGYMLGKGSTTIWERWDGDTRDPSMNSESLLILAGNLDAWYYQTLAGIRPAAAAFKKILIKPELVGDLAWAKAHFDSPYGRIATDWKIVSPTTLTLESTIPANTTAVIHVPLGKLKNATISEGGTVIWKNGNFTGAAGGIGYEGADAKSARFTVGSGTYLFTATGTAIPVPLPPIIVDNDGPGAQLTGAWTRETTSEPTQRYGASFAYAPAGNGAIKAEFRPQLPTAGTYRVYALWTSHANRATNASYTVTHSGGTSTVVVNQELNGGRWNLLGSYTFSAGNGGYVTLTNAANEYVIADAVKFEPANPLADGSEAMLDDSFDVTIPGSELNAELATRQRGFIAPASWRANADNIAGQVLLGNVVTMAPQALVLTAAATQPPAGAGLLANLAAASTGRIVIRFDARCLNANGNPDAGASLLVTNSPLAASPTVPSAANAIGIRFRADGGCETLLAGVSQGNAALPWTADSSVSKTIKLVLTDATGVGSPFKGNGTVAKIYDGADRLLASHPLAQLTAAYVHLGATASSWEINNFGISDVAPLVSYQTWIRSFYPGAGNPANLDLNADPDGDGINNFTEFALNSHAKGGTNRGIAQPSIEPGSDPTFVVATFRGLAFTAGADGSQTSLLTSPGPAYTIEGSRDLSSWSEAVMHVSHSNTAPPSTGFPDLTSTPWEYHTFSLPRSEVDSSKGFLRARITAP